MAAAGSPFGIRGIDTIPAPNRPRVLDDLEDPVRAEPTDRAVGRLTADCTVGGAGGGVGTDPGGGGAVPQTSQ
ncbi:hypothetical protein TUM20985_41760 [Mycobacterium antarcticum]|nr:hypothetical protein TUM20985_41760 [Mycolicibacterium sp. TUM20985]GLP76798.1 hypothetical protein TUM20983_39080 [Mycolicibacterium sp. TUM20983]GLP82762.1 hypothetical protein TUM20984_41820 [Mycolicibacterium sp. TUM20984]